MMAASDIVAMAARRLWGLVLWIFGLFRRLLCRIRLRGRKNSGTILPMTTDHIAAVSDIPQCVPSNEPEVELESWDSWGAEDQSSAATNSNQHGRLHASYQSNHHVGLQGVDESEPEVDFFQDMVPTMRTTKIRIKKKREDHFTPSGLSNRLAMTSEVPLTDGELGTWEDQENAWGEEVSEDLSWEAEAAIKEKKRLERERRQAEQLRKKQEKEQSRLGRKDGLAAVRLS